MKQIAIGEHHLYNKAYSKGNRAVADSVAVYVLRDKHAALLRKQNPMKETVNRVGISSSKKIGGAVGRNRAKRVIREAYREIDREVGIKRGFLIVIAARTAATEKKMQDVKRDMQYCLRRLDMLIPAKKDTAAEAAVQVQSDDQLHS